MLDKQHFDCDLIFSYNSFSIAAKIGIFYTIFYGVLAALVAICMWVFFQTLDPRIPKWKLEKSIIGTNPGNYYKITLFSFVGIFRNRNKKNHHFVLQVLVSVHCHQKIMWRVHWFGTKEQIMKTIKYGLKLWHRS